MRLPGRKPVPLAQRNVHVTVSIPPKQYEWVRKKGAQYSAILSSAISKLMQTEEDAQAMAPSATGLKVQEWRKMGLSDAEIMTKLREEKGADAAALSTDAQG